MPGRDREVWIGGQLPAPFLVEEDGGYRPRLTLWLQAPEPLVLHSEIEDPREPALPFGQTLLNAIAHPLVGKRRRPGFVRVATEDLAAEVRRVCPGTEVEIAPTPEIQSVILEMAEHFNRQIPMASETYLREGISPEAVAAMFRAAGVLHIMAPWRSINGDLPLRLDAPDLGLEGACLSIIGNLGESFGFILFESLRSFERFTDPAVSASGGLDLGGPILSLTFVERGELEPARLEEIDAHGWNLTGNDSAPIVTFRAADAFELPAAERQYRVVTKIASALALFTGHHRDAWDAERDEPICEAFRDHEDVEVRITLPYQAWQLFQASVEAREDGPLRIDAVLRQRLEKRLDQRNDALERLAEFVESSDELQAELPQAAREFLVGKSLDSTDALREVMHRCIQWFTCERVSTELEARPLDAFISRRCKAGDRARFARLGKSVAAAVIVRVVDPGNGFVVECLASGRRLVVFGPGDAQDVAVGMMLVGRFFPLDERFWTLGESTLLIRDEGAVRDFEVRVARWVERFGQPPSQLELEGLITDSEQRDAESYGELEREPPRSRLDAPPPSRNAPCPCGSGKWYKRCCGRR